MWKELNPTLKTILVIWIVFLHLFFAGLIYLYFDVTGGMGLGSSLETPTPEQRTKATAVAWREANEAFVDSIEPCMVRSDIEIEPCAPRRRFGFDHVIPLSSVYPEFPPTFEELLSGPYRLYSTEEGLEDVIVGYVHMVVRGIFDVDSTSCTGYSFAVPAWLSGEMVTTSAAGETMADDELASSQVTCFSEFSVHEYLVGRGPSMIVIQLPNSSFHHWTDDAYDEERESLAPRIADKYEGVEWVAWLGPSYNGIVESLTAYALWDVQKGDDGVVRVVSPDAAFYEDAGVSGSALDTIRVPHADFHREIKAAHAARVERTSGRIGIDMDTPMLVTDVLELDDYYEEVGTYYPPVDYSHPPPKRPYPPRELFATLRTEPRPGVDLEWTEPTSSFVWAYKILRVDDRGYETTVATDIRTMHYTDPNPPRAGSEYTYTVVAVNDYGESLPSAPYRLRVP